MTDEKGRRDEMDADKDRAAAALSTSETVSRYGSANAEYVKGYSGIDHETGQIFAKNLKKIAEGKVNPNHADNNIKQQAGYSAEVAATSHDNAELIINKSPVRVSRSDDLSQYGRNHEVVDRVKILNGEIIDGSQKQMKFVGDYESLLDDIFTEGKNGDHVYSKYRSVKLELPSEQVEKAKEYCRRQAENFRKQAEGAALDGRPTEVVEKLRRNAERFQKAADSDQIIDSGLTTADSIYYRTHPKMATAIDIAKTSHRAGLEGAKFGAIIGVAISIFQNSLSVAQEKKELNEAARDVVIGTAQAGVLGYGTAFAGSAIKGAMQQSGSAAARALSKTNAPVLALSVCISLGSSIRRYANDEITDAQFLEEVGEKGAGMLSSGMMSALGQLAIPIPFVGAAIGGMIGYTLSSMFYQSALDAGRQADVSRERLQRIQEIESAARIEIDRQRAALSEFMQKEFPELMRETEELFECISSRGMMDSDAFAAAINSYAELMGAQLQFKTQMEFDDFMLNSDESLLLNKPISE